VIGFDRLAVEAPEFSTATFAVHTQWIESTLLSRLEAQLRPAPLTDAALQRFPVEIDGRRVVLGLPTGLLAGIAGSAASAPSGSAEADPAGLHAPVPGALVRWLADDGATVSEGDTVAVLDAMKMETPVLAHRAGTLAHAASVGDVVDADAVIGRID
jgi:acetyl-CoA/propionyl-CoA carboxylase biotin carboxyl carrier protein